MLKINIDVVIRRPDLKELLQKEKEIIKIREKNPLTNL